MVTIPDTRYQSILLFGAPGSGKGTQGKILGAIPGFFHLSSGDPFRSLDIHAEIGKVFYEFSSRGELVPDEITIEFWKRNLDAHTVLSNYKPHDDLLVLDGIPRNVRQSEMLDEYINVLRIIHLDCPDPGLMIKRIRRRALKENRIDDAREEVIRNRWQVYEEQTRPVLACYPPEIVCAVNAAQSPSGVLFDVLKFVVPAQEAHYRNQQLLDRAAKNIK